MLTTKQLDYINQCRAAFLQQLAVVLGQRITEPYNMLSSEMAKKYDVVSEITRLHLLEIPVSPQELAALELEICHAVTQFAVVCKSVIEQCDELGVKQLAHAAVSNLFEFMRRDTSSELSWDAANLFKAISEGNGALWPLSDPAPLSVMGPYQHLLHYSSPSTVYHDHPAVYVEPQVPRMSSLLTVDLDLNGRTDSRFYEALRGFQQDFSRCYQVLPQLEKAIFQSRVLSLPDLQQRLYDRYRCRKAALPMIEPEIIMSGNVRQPLYEYLVSLQKGHNQLAIAGSPLSGKSTLAHYMEEMLWRTRYSPIGRLPFIINGEKLALLKDNADLVEAYLKKYYDLTSQEVAQLETQRMQDHTVGIFFIIDAACAEKTLLERLLIDVQQWIYAQCLWVLPAGLRMINLQKLSPRQAILADFSPEQIDQYWYTRGVAKPEANNVDSMALIIEGEEGEEEDEPVDRGSMVHLIESRSPLTQMMLANYVAKHPHDSQNTKIITQYTLYEHALQEYGFSSDVLSSMSAIAIDCFNGKKAHRLSPLEPLPDFLTQSIEDEGYCYQFNNPHWYEFFVAQQFIAEYRQSDLRPSRTFWNACVLRGEHEGIARFIAQYFNQSPVEAIDFLYKRFSMHGYAEEWNNATINANRIVSYYLRHHPEMTVNDLKQRDNPHFVATRAGWEMRMMDAIPLTISQRGYIYGELGHGAGVTGGTTHYDEELMLSSVRYQHVNTTDVLMADHLFDRAVDCIKRVSDETFHHLVPSMLAGYNSKTRLQELSSYADRSCLLDGKVAFLTWAINAFTGSRADALQSLQDGLEAFIQTQYEFFKAGITQHHNIWIDAEGKRRSCYEQEVIELRWEMYKQHLRAYVTQLLQRFSDESVSAVDELQQELQRLKKEQEATQSNREFLAMRTEHMQYSTLARLLLLLERYGVKEKFLAEPDRMKIQQAVEDHDDLSQVTSLLQRLLLPVLNEPVFLALPKNIAIEKRRVLESSLNAFIDNNCFLKGHLRKESREWIMDALEHNLSIESYFNLDGYAVALLPRDFHRDLSTAYYNTLSQYLATREDTREAWAAFSDKKKQRLMRSIEAMNQGILQRDDINDQLESLMDPIPDDLLSSIETCLSDSREVFFKNWLTVDYPDLFEALDESTQQQLLAAVALNHWDKVEVCIKKVLPSRIAAEFYGALPSIIRAGIKAGIEAQINSSLAFSTLEVDEFFSLVLLIKERSVHNPLDEALFGKINRLHYHGECVKTAYNTPRFLVESLSSDELHALKQFLDNAGDEGKALSKKLVFTNNTAMMAQWQSATLDKNLLIDALLKENYHAFCEQFYDFMNKPSADFLERYLRFGLSPDACHSKTHMTLLAYAVKKLNNNTNPSLVNGITNMTQHLLYCGATVGVHYNTVDGDETLLNYVETNKENFEEIAKQLLYRYTVFELDNENEEAIFYLIRQAVNHLIAYQDSRDVLSMERDASWLLRLLATIKQSDSMAEHRRESVKFYETCLQTLITERLSPEVTLKAMEDHAKTVERRLFGLGKSTLNDPIIKIVSPVLARITKAAKGNPGALITMDERASLSGVFHQRASEFTRHSTEHYAHRRAIEQLEAMNAAQDERTRNMTTAQPKEESESEQLRKMQERLDTAEREKAQVEQEKAQAEREKAQAEQAKAQAEQEKAQVEQEKALSDEKMRQLEEEIKAMKQAKAMRDEEEVLIAQLMNEIDLSQHKKTGTVLQELAHVSNETKSESLDSEKSEKSQECFGRSQHTLHGRKTPSPKYENNLRSVETNAYESDEITSEIQEANGNNILH